MESSKPIPKGQIEDYISNSTQTALDLKLGINATSDNLSQGTTNLYFTMAKVLATLLSGLSFVTGGAIVSTDTVVQAFGKIQKQITDLSTIYQAILVSGTNIKTINGGSILGSGNLVVGGAERLLLNKTFSSTFRLTPINTWKGNYSYSLGEYMNTYGTGSSPSSSFFLGSDSTAIPDGYIIDEIQMYIKYKEEGSYVGDLEVYITRSETGTNSNSNGISNTVVIANQTIHILNGSANVKNINNLTINSHSLPTLAKSFLQFGFRDTSNNDIYYNINFNIIFKKP